MKLQYALLIFTMAAYAACTKGGKPVGVTGNMYAVSAAASAKQLVPAIDTTSTSTFTGVYDQELNSLTFTIAWDDLWRDTKKDTIINISFYGPATITTNGQLIKTLPFVNPNKAGSINLGLSGITGFSGQQVTDFMAGSYYYTINTKRYPSGIVRGQLALNKK